MATPADVATAYRAGWQANKDGAKATATPGDLGPELATAWRNGWYDAYCFPTRECDPRNSGYAR
jgi:hypothetical protein